MKLFVTNTFGVLLDLSRTVGYWQPRLNATPALTYKACVLLQNMIACSTQSSWGSQYFGCALPTLDEYVAMADVVDEA